MKIAGLVKNTLIDYPGKIAAIVFTQGCNFRCGFCHNPELLDIDKPGEISESEVLDFLKKRSGLLDGLVITGGEPTMQPDLIDFIAKVKAMGYLIKLDTNGSNSKVLKSLIERGLVDYVAMDVKGPLSSYEKICGYLNTKIVQESIDIIKKSKVDYEFRTTLLPFYHSENDISEIGRLIEGAKLFTLQGFRPEVTFLDELRDENSFSKDELKKFETILKDKAQTIRVIDNL